MSSSSSSGCRAFSNGCRSARAEPWSSSIATDMSSPPPTKTAIAQQRLGQMPMLGELGATNPLLALADDMIDSKKVNLQSVGDPRQFEITSPKDGRSYYVTFAALKFGGWIAATGGTRQRLPHQHRRKCPLSAGGAGGADAGDGGALGHAHQSPGRAPADPHRRAAQALSRTSGSIRWSASPRGCASSTASRRRSCR